MIENIGVIGSASMVASQFIKQAEEGSKATFTKADLQAEIAVDITDERSVEDFIKNYDFSWVVLFSAYTDVNGAEKQRGDTQGICYKINVEGARNVAQACAKHGKKLIFLSTDFVFDGTNGPYSEDDPTGPNKEKVSWYGLTKLMAEEEIQKSGAEAVIIRIAYPYSGKFVGKDDLATRLARLYREGQLYPMYDDQVITPTFIPDLAPAILLIIENNRRGIFHLVSPKETTQYDFAKKLVTAIGGDPSTIKIGSLKESNKEASATPRPQKGGLKVDKITKLGFTPTDWGKGIEEAAKNIEMEH